MPKKATDALVEFRADDVFEFTGLRVSLVLVNPESVLEKPFRQPVTPDHVPRAALPAIGELHFMIFLHPDESQILHPRQCPNWIHAAWRSNVFQIRPIAFFPANPNLLQQVIEMDAIIH